MVKPELLKELVEDWYNGKLSNLSAMIVVSLIINPQEPNREDIKWAQTVIASQSNYT